MQNDKPIRCPNCHSSQITAHKKGFGLGKAAGGWVLLGPVGLLGGVIGSGKIRLTCMNCGCQFKPGHRPTAKRAAPDNTPSNPDEFLITVTVLTVLAGVPVLLVIGLLKWIF